MVGKQIQIPIRVGAMEETYVLRVESSISAPYWLDIFDKKKLVHIVTFVWKRPKINEKYAGDGKMNNN